MALAVTVLGYLWWSWIWPRSGVPDIDRFFLLYHPAVSVTAFFALALTCSLIYFWYRKVHVMGPAIVGIGLIMALALPFALYDTTPVHFFAGIALVVSYMTWHAYASGTAVGRPMGGLTGADFLNQAWLVPINNLGVWFASLRALGRENKKSNQWLFAVVGLIIGLPVIAAVMGLLMSSDAHFGDWMTRLSELFAQIDVWGFLWRLSLGLFIAVPLAGLLYGNTRRDGASSMSAEKVEGWGKRAHRVAKVAIATPISVLCLMYLVFFVATGSSLFVAFTDRGPAFAYAEYARSGFFQLVTVAAINLGVLAAARLFMKRDEGVYPRSARVLGVVLSAQTLLLVVTAISKLLLYIDQFGLTRLRLYTVWFCGVLFVVFALIAVWHVSRFAVGRPILIFMVIAFMGLLWANTDALIARYNVHRYMSGQVQTMDVAYLYELSTASVPALIDLREQAPEQSVREWADDILKSRAKDRADHPWTSWNWQLERKNQILGR